jgi:hypothetical protein
MSGLLNISFLQPWILTGLVILPALWWLLRLLPPSPRQVFFAPLRLLRGLVVHDVTAARMPWWLLLLRLLLVAFLIIGLAEPVLNPQTGDDRHGPMVIVLDDGWASAADWPQRLRLAGQSIDQAERDNRSVLLTGTTLPGQRFEIQTANQARQQLNAWQPKPFLPARDKLASLLTQKNPDLYQASLLWIDDGLAGPGDADLTAMLKNLGPLTMTGSKGERAMILRPPQLTSAGLELTIDRLGGVAEIIHVRAVARDGRVLGEQAINWPVNNPQVKATLPLPPAWRNQVGRLVIADHPGGGGAAAVYLMDERHLRRPVTLIGDPASALTQPLLSPGFYLEQALAPFHDLTVEPLDETLKKIDAATTEQPAMIVLGDGTTLTQSQQSALAKWIDGGGVLVRFAGSSLSAADDVLIPTRLRQQDRLLGGALTWEKPLPLAEFLAPSPFTGLKIPDDVTINRQILAEPSIDLPGKTWASLKDSTPLVTADRRGRGRLVLFHVTASPEWSSLPLSGVFVEMLRRLSALSEQDRSANSTTNKDDQQDVILQPVEILNGFGQSITAGADVKPLALKQAAQWQPSLEHPPGLYARPPVRLALNLGDYLKPPMALERPGDVIINGFDRPGEQPLKAGFLLLCLMMLVVDGVLSLALRGLMPNLARAAIIAVIFAPITGHAAEFDLNRAMQATDRPFLGFIVTGDAMVDQQSQAGLDGLARIMRQRTAADVPGGLPVDPERDELSFFPLIYWPMTATQPPLSDAAVARINAYLGRGGMIVFDTRDQDQGNDASNGTGMIGTGVARLRQLARGIDIPPLQPVNAKHVLSKAFYLLTDFPGRLSGGPLWVEANDERRHDGVAGIVISSHDLAAAWAIDSRGQPMVPMGLGGEKQREMAYRAGVNLVMYVLTGNYKADQVHVPFILERLGQ